MDGLHREPSAWSATMIYAERPFTPKGNRIIFMSSTDSSAFVQS